MEKQTRQSGWIHKHNFTPTYKCSFSNQGENCYPADIITVIFETTPKHSKDEVVIVFEHINGYQMERRDT